MADFIKIIPERMREEANKVRSYRDEHVEIMSRLNNLVFSLSESWDGEAQRAFVSRYRGMQRKFEQFDEMLRSVSDAMDDNASKMQSADASLASRINSLQ